MAKHHHGPPPLPTRNSIPPEISYGQQFNATASLLYDAQPTPIRIYDVQHGNLVRTLQIPDGLTGSLDTLTSSATHLLAIHPVTGQVVTITAKGLSIFTFRTDPLSIGSVTLVAGQLTVSGSGFLPASTLTVDTLAVPATFVDADHLSAQLPALASGPHSVTVIGEDGKTYTLALAFNKP